MEKWILKKGYLANANYENDIPTEEPDFDFSNYDLEFPVKKIDKKILKLGFLEIDRRNLSIYKDN